jgi:hypothetical protein
MTTRQNVDGVVLLLREFVQALIDQGQIAGRETVTQAQTNLRDALHVVLGVKESAEP